ncbi:11744_t:CDS:2, partial [Funneliformis caledonium]
MPLTKKQQKLYEKQLQLSNSKFGSKKLNDNQDNDASELEISAINTSKITSFFSIHETSPFNNTSIFANSDDDTDIELHSELEENWYK